MAQEPVSANKYEDTSVAKLEGSYLTVGWLWNNFFHGKVAQNQMVVVWNV